MLRRFRSRFVLFEVQHFKLREKAAILSKKKKKSLVQDSKHTRDYYGNSICPRSLVANCKAGESHVTQVRVKFFMAAATFISWLLFVLIHKETWRTPALDP